MKLKLNAENPFIIEMEDGEFVTDLQSCGPELEERELSKARRIVACVNACEGIETEALEYAIAENIELDFTGRSKRIAELERTIPEINTALLEALKKMKEVTKVLGKGVGSIAVPDGFFQLWNEAEVAANAAIAEAENTEPTYTRATII